MASTDGDGADPANTAERWPSTGVSHPGVDETLPTDEAAGRDEWPEVEDLSGREFAGRYRLVEKIGEGAMGHVYLAEHTTIRKPVAIKVLSPAYRGRKDVVTRFLHEAQAASAIRHENVVDITDFGQTDEGSVFFVMEYLEGQPLSTAVRQGGPLPWPRAKAVMLQILDALGSAHDLDIVHRDMKAENCFLVTRSGGREVVKVLDFGIAKVNTDGESDLTRTGVIMGTANYMSPEQAHGDSVDSRTDLYSCGVILFELLAGRLPFLGNNPMSVMYKHLHTPPPRLGEAGVEVPAAVEAVVARALLKKREERFQTAAEFMEALRAIPDDAATVPGASGKGSKTWMIVTVGIALAVAAAVGIGVALQSGDQPEADEAGERVAGVGATDRVDPEPTEALTPEPGDSLPQAPGADGAGGDTAGETGEPGAADAAAEPGEDTLGDAEPAEAGSEASEPAELTAPKASSGSSKSSKRTTKTLAKTLRRKAGKPATSCLEREGAFPGEKVRVSLTVGPDGKVTKAKVKGKHAGTPMGRCVEAVVKKTSFPSGATAQTLDHSFSL